jgi:zinc protease
MKLFVLAFLGLSLSSCFFIVAEDDGAGVSVRRSTKGSSEASTMGTSEAATSARPASASRAGDPASGGVFPYVVHEKKLANDLKVLVVPMPSDGLVSYWSVVRTGSRDEVEPGVTGFAHFFEHMMFRGTEKLPGPEYDNVVNSMGADANAFTNDDITAYHLTIAKDHLPKVVEIEADRFQNLKYDEAQFKTEAGAVYGEYRKSRTSPFSVLFEALQNAAFDVHTYKHTTIGFEADIQAMPENYEYSKSFFQRFYRPENVVIVVVGDVEPAETFALVERHYGGWKKGYVEPKVPVEPPQTAQRRITVPFEGQTLPILTIAFKGERFLPGDRKMVAGLLVGDLVFGETSSIYKKLVLDEQRLEMLGASFSPSRDPSLWAVFAMVKDPADVAAIEGELWSAIAALVRDGVPEERLDQIRSREKYSFLSSLTSPQAVQDSIAYFVAMTGGIRCIDQMYATLDQVTPADVVAAAQAWLRPENATVAVLHAEGEPLPEAKAGGEPPVLMPVPVDPNVVFKLWFKTGSQDDPPGKEGLAALVGALISEGGTKTKSYDQILKELFPLAAGYGVSVDKEMTVITGSVHRDKLDAFYGLFVDVVLNPGFRAEDFERLRENAINGIEKSLRFSSDEELGKAALTAEVFRGTPYAHIPEGTVESLRSITLDDVRAFWEARYAQGNLVIALGGAYPPELERRLQADLARLAPGAPAPTAASVAPEIHGRQVLIVEKPGPSTAISFGFPIDLARGSKEYYALWIANSWLGEHRNSSSHLYQVIREARGINYGDYSYIEAFPGGGFRHVPPTGVGRRSQMFEVWIRPVPEERAVFSLRAALREVEHLVANGLTEEQFEFTRRFLKGYIQHFADSTEARLGYAVDDRFYGLDESHLARFRRMLDEVTLADVNAAVKKHLQAENLVIAMVTADAAKMKEALVSGATSPIDYGGIEKPAEILAEDREIERHPLGIGAEDVRIVPVQEMFEGAAGDGRVGAKR